jgi:hypothetical protein
MKKLNKKVMTCNLHEIPTIFFMKLSFDQRKSYQTHMISFCLIRTTRTVLGKDSYPRNGEYIQRADREVLNNFEDDYTRLLMN